MKLLNREELEHRDIEWLTLGNLDTIYFAARTNYQQAKNTTLGNLNTDGSHATTREDLTATILTHFKNYLRKVTSLHELPGFQEL